MSQQNRYFISGHTDLSFDDFIKHYKEPILIAIKNDPNCTFVVGDAPGVDIMAQHLLIRILGEDGINRITVYHIGTHPKNIVFINDTPLKSTGGFTSHTAKDKAMTLASDIDIAYVRSNEESKLLYGDKFNPKRISGTQQNINRRRKLKRRDS